jgi:hypothetical protein
MTKILYLESMDVLQQFSFLNFNGQVKKDALYFMNILLRQSYTGEINDSYIYMSKCLTLIKFQIRLMDTVY